jgi:hypothetical protein
MNLLLSLGVQNGTKKGNIERQTFRKIEPLLMRDYSVGIALPPR